MTEKQLTTVDRRVEKALEMRALDMPWRTIAKKLGVDRSNLIKQVKDRCPEAVLLQFTPKERRDYFTGVNTQLLQKAGQRLDEALDNGEIEARDLPKTYGILTDKQVKLEGWDRRSEGEGSSFGEALAKSLSDGGKFKIEFEPREIIDVTPEDEDG